MQKLIPRFIFIPVLVVIPHIYADIGSDIYSLFSVREVVHFQAVPHRRELRYTDRKAQESPDETAHVNSGTNTTITRSASANAEDQASASVAANLSEPIRYERTNSEQSPAVAVDGNSQDSPRSAGSSSAVQASAGSVAESRDGLEPSVKAAFSETGAYGDHSKISGLNVYGRGAGAVAKLGHTQRGFVNRVGRGEKRTAAEPTGQGPRMPDLVKETGYPVETHYVETKDGYVLALHRVRKKNFAMQSPRVALMWHGFLGSSADWVLNGPEHGLAYLLANDDIDVWMGNSRGNIYSRNHTKLDTESSDFWNFSMHEIGKYDVMASIDYVMKETFASKIFAITHSTGVAGFLIALNERGIYQNRLHGLVAMAPVTSVKYTASKLMNLLMSSYGLLKTELLEFFIGKTYLDTPKLLEDSLAPTFCTGEVASPYCGNPLFMLTGFPDQPFRPTPQLINANTPAGTSKKLLIHLAQMGLSGLFQNFDLGEDENQDVYGFSWAPDYIIDKLMTRVIFFSSKDDVFVSDQDVAQLARQIARLQAKIKVKRPNFGHTDFLWAQDVREQVYERLLREINGLVGH